MRINSLDIKGFGRLKAMKIAPQEGFNIVYEPNEAGKSTLQALIRAMLYGLRGGRKAKDGSLPPAKAYKPWNYDQYAGVMEYTLDNGKGYRVGRNFDKGTTNIYDAAANNLTGQFPQDKETGPRFAEEQLGIDEATFERSALIRQLQCPIDEDGRKNLVEKLSNLNTAGSEELSLTKAISTLEGALLEKVGTGRSTTRPLDKIVLRLSELEQKKQQLTALREQYLETYRNLHEKKASHQGLTRKLDELLKIKESRLKGKFFSLKCEISKLDNQLLNTKRQLEETKECLNTLSIYEGIGDSKLQEANLLLYDIRELEASIDSLKTEASGLDDKIASTENSLKDQEAKKEKTRFVEETLKSYSGQKSGAEQQSSNKKEEGHLKHLLPSFSGIVLALVFMVLYFVSKSQLFLVIGFIFTIAAIAFLMVAALKRGKNTPPSNKANTIELALQEAGFTTMESFLDYKEECQKSLNLLESFKQQRSDKSRQLESLANRHSDSIRKLEDIFSAAGLTDDDASYTEKVEKLQSNIRELNRLKTKVQELLAEERTATEKAGYLLREASSLLNVEVKSLAELEHHISSRGITEEDNGTAGRTDISNDITADIENVRNRIKSVELEITALEIRTEAAPSEEELLAVTEEIAELTEKREILQRAGESLTLAGSVLKEVALNLQRDYTPALNNEMCSMVNQLTSGRYQKVLTNDSLQVNLEVPETDELISVGRLSGGTIDQVYFAMRLSSIKLIENGREHLPVIMDEPFSQYDEERLQKAFELLKDFSRDHQIFFFTCREREFELATKIFGDKLNRIKL